MDWLAVAVVLAERALAPVVLLDRDGRIRLLNPAMERLLAVTRFEAEGRPFEEVCLPRDEGLGAGRWIAEALRGTVHNFETVLVAATGKRYLVEFELTLVGLSGDQGLVVGAGRISPVASEANAAHELEYEVVMAGANFGQLLKFSDAAGAAVQLGARCYTVIFGREGPCADCPLLRSNTDDWPRYSARFVEADGNRAPPVYRLSSADRLTDTTARVRTRRLSEAELAAIHQAKLKGIGDRASLSQRERDVLGYLLMGRSIEDIAALLQITSRTVSRQRLGAQGQPG